MLKKTQKYNFKKLLPIAMIGLLPAAFNACEEPEEITKIDKTLVFSQTDSWDLVEPFSKVKKYDKDKSVENIYLQPEGSFGGSDMNAYLNGIKNTMEQSPKVKAAPGATFIYPLDTSHPSNGLTKPDSLEFVALGYMFQKEYD